MANDRDLLQGLGRAVKARRELMGLSQADLAERGGPGETTVSRLERGDGAMPRAATQLQLEAALDLWAGAVRRFLSAERAALEVGPNRMAVKAEPLGGTSIFVKDEVLGAALGDMLRRDIAVGDTLTFADPDEAQRALAVSGQVKPMFPVELVHTPTGDLYEAGDRGDLWNMVLGGDYKLKYPVAGLNIAVHRRWNPEGSNEIASGGDTHIGTTAGESPPVSRVCVAESATPPRKRGADRTRVNPDGTVERSPISSLRWRTVGDIGDRGAALVQALEVLRSLPTTDHVIHGTYHVAQVLEALAENVGREPGAAAARSHVDDLTTG